MSSSGCLSRAVGADADAGAGAGGRVQGGCWIANVRCNKGGVALLRKEARRPSMVSRSEHAHWQPKQQYMQTNQGPRLSAR
jgi:hypothetical protein